MNRIQEHRWGVLSAVTLVLAIGLVFFDRVFLSRHGSTALSWVRPSTTESGIPVTNLAGYTIHCWGESGRYTNTVRIDDPSVTRYDIEGLPPGRYQCAVSAFTEDDLESALSNVVARTVK
jgi:hypothetical protein